MKIAILVGHGKSKSGGYDSGAVSKDKQYHEFKIAKEVAKYAAEALETYDCEVALVNYNGGLSLVERISKFKNNAYAFIAEIHLNAAGGTGTEVYCYPGDKIGKSYAAAISQSVSSAMGIKNRGAKESDYYGIIRETTPTAVLVETCFIDNDNDLNKIKTVAGQKTAGEAIAKAIATTAKLSKKTASTPATHPETPANTALYKVQVGAFANKANADKLAAELKAKGYSAFVTK